MALRPLVGVRFQILFHSPRRGSFHLSLTVLVRYRSSRIFSLGQWSARFPTRFLVSRGTQVAAPSCSLSLTGFSPSLTDLSSVLQLAFHCASAAPPTPISPKRYRFGLFPFRSPLLGKYSLLLWVLRCFSSPRSPSFRCAWPSAKRVSPFGYPRILACTRLPEAFRSVPRPSSVLDA